MHAVQAAALWSGLLILMMLVLSGIVVSGRRRHHGFVRRRWKPRSDGRQPSLRKLVEYATPGMIAMLLLAAVGAPAWMVHGVGATLLVGRVAHALGLLFQTGPSLGRVIGMLLTWVALLIAAVGLIAFAVV
jgi:uncharacterized protein